MNAAERRDPSPRRGCCNIMSDMTHSIVIRQGESAGELEALINKIGHKKDSDYAPRCLRLQQQSERILYIAAWEGTDAGYGFVNFNPKYHMFQRLGIPEIQDLNVAADYRRMGIATALIRHFENTCLERNFSHVGLGVGLTREYGPAQRLYVKLGYIPDGSGLVYDAEPLRHGALRPADDDLNLMLIKEFSRKTKAGF